MADQESALLAAIGALQYQVFEGRPLDEWAACLKEREARATMAIARADDEARQSRLAESNAQMRRREVERENSTLQRKYVLVVEQRNTLLSQLSDIAVALGTADSHIDALLERIACGYRHPDDTQSYAYEYVPF